MVNVPLFAGNPQLQEQLRLQLPVFLQQVSEEPEPGGWDLRGPQGVGCLLLPAASLLLSFPTRCRTRSRSPSSPTPVPCRRCCRSSRGCRPCRPRPPDWYPGEVQAAPPSTTQTSYCVSEGLFSCFLQLVFLLDLMFPSLSQRPSPSFWSLPPTASAPSGCPGHPRPQQAAPQGLCLRPPPPRRPRRPHPLQLGLPAPSSSSCSR